MKPKRDCADKSRVRIALTSRIATAAVVGLGVSGLWAGVAQAGDQLAYVANSQAGTITQLDLNPANPGATAAPIKVGSQPVALAITPNGSMAYVADYGSSELVPVALATGLAGTPIQLIDRPSGVAISPSGTRAYVVSDNGREYTLSLPGGQLLSQTRIPANSNGIAISSSGTAYITNVADATIAELSLTGGGLGSPINLTSPTPDGIAITGTTAYVASNSGGTVSAINLSTNQVTGNPIQAGTAPTAIALSPDGSTAYVTDAGGQVMSIDLTQGFSAQPLLNLASGLSGIALVPPGGITAAPPNTGGGSSTGTGATTTTLGNQQLTLTVSGSSGASATQGCLVPRSTVRVRLTRRTLPGGHRLTLRYVTFRLGKQTKRARHLPATVRLSVTGLHAGTNILSVHVVYHERVVTRDRKHHKRRLTVTISKVLRAHVSVCV